LIRLRRVRVANHQRNCRTRHSNHTVPSSGAGGPFDARPGRTICAPGSANCAWLVAILPGPVSRLGVSAGSRILHWSTRATLVVLDGLQAARSSNPRRRPRRRTPGCSAERATPCFGSGTMFIRAGEIGLDWLGRGVYFLNSRLRLIWRAKGFGLGVAFLA
jgi:hypothetical protein